MRVDSQMKMCRAGSCQRVARGGGLVPGTEPPSPAVFMRLITSPDRVLGHRPLSSPSSHRPPAPPPRSSGGGWGGRVLIL